MTDSLNKIEEIMNGTRYRWEAICIDDESKDDTPRFLREFTQKKKNLKAIYHKKNIGRGGTVTEGMKKAKGRVVGYIDVDLEVSPVYIPEFIRAIDKGADVAIATRIYGKGLTGMFRWIASKVYVSIVRNYLSVGFKDTEAGYKFFNRKKFLPVLRKTRNKAWFFDTEIVTRSVWEGLKVVEIPVLFIRRTDKASTVRLFQDSIDYLIAVRRFRKQNER